MLLSIVLKCLYVIVVLFGCAVSFLKFSFSLLHFLESAKKLKCQELTFEKSISGKVLDYYFVFNKLILICTASCINDTIDKCYKRMNNVIL